MKTKSFICLALVAKQSGLSWPDVAMELRLKGVKNPIPFIGMAKAVLDIKTVIK
jgi:hypothetical protein